MVNHVRRQIPSFKATLRVGKMRQFPKPRDFAHCRMDGPPWIIVVRPDFVTQPRSRQLGLLAHELAHAALMQLGDFDHSEREADRAARQLFGHPINYDYDDVQRWGGKRRSRPRYLPK